MKKVLVVDDTKNIRILLTRCLELEGYEVVTANDGQQALLLLQNGKFDLIFLDIKMPELSGTEVLKKIRGMGVDIPVIIITAYATIKNAVECTQMGAVAYLQKPFTADKVRSILSELQDRINRKPAQPDTADVSSQYDSDAVINLIEKGSFDEALALLKRALSQEPANPETFLLLARTYEGLGNIEYANKFYKAAKLFNGD